MIGWSVAPTVTHPRRFAAADAVIAILAKAVVRLATIRSGDL